MLLPSAVHVSSTFEFGAMFHDCLSADPQGNPPFSPFFRSPMNVIAKRCSCILHLQVWSPGKLLHSAVRQFSIIHFFSEPHECYCPALFMHPPPTSLEPREVIA